MRKIEKLEVSTSEIAARLTKNWGYTLHNTPRWLSIKYCAKYSLGMWNYCRKNHYQVSRKQALHVIGMQTFTGLTPEWVEKNLPWC